MSQSDKRPDETRPDDRTYVEQFTPTDLMRLRSELLQSGVDSFQAAEIVANFLSGRGYGVSHHEARAAASRIEVPGCHRRAHPARTRARSVSDVVSSVIDYCVISPSGSSVGESISA